MGAFNRGFGPRQPAGNLGSTAIPNPIANAATPPDAGTASLAGNRFAGLGPPRQAPGNVNGTGIPNSYIPQAPAATTTPSNPTVNPSGPVTTPPVNPNAPGYTPYGTVQAPSNDPAVFMGDPNYIRNLNLQAFYGQADRTNNSLYQNWLQTGANGAQPQYTTVSKPGFDQWWNSFGGVGDAPSQAGIWGGSAGQPGNPFTSYMGQSQPDVTSQLTNINQSLPWNVPTGGIQQRQDLGHTSLGGNANSTPPAATNTTPQTGVSKDALGNTLYNGSSNGQNLNSVLSLYALMSLLGGGGNSGGGGQQASGSVIIPGAFQQGQGNVFPNIFGGGQSSYGNLANNVNSQSSNPLMALLSSLGMTSLGGTSNQQSFF